MTHHDFWKSNVTVDERLKRIADMTERECAFAVRLEGTQPSVKDALWRRMRKLQRQRQGKSGSPSPGVVDQSKPGAHGVTRPTQGNV